MSGVSLVRLMTDALTPEEVEPLLHGRFGRPYVYRETCDSTQGLLEPDAPEGALAAANEQVAGRGRLGRTWQAPAGTALLCSIVLRPPEDRRAAELSLVGGLAAAEMIEAATGLATQIKWPNDVMLNRRKVAGVLAESSDGAVVLGIGVNVNQTRDELPEDTAGPVASLLTTDAVRRERAPLLALLVADLERNYQAWLEGGLASLYGELGARDFLRNRRIYLDGEEGRAIMIQRDGCLEVEVGGQKRLVESGEVTYER
jgi:BirA family transcriptional regulator, biotin operon repressor / biotin---[acetyl-CoA-carboxylase] ligase